MDHEAIVARFGGDTGLVGELVALFVADCPRMIEDVRRSIQSESAEDLRCAAHAFKGCVANFTDSGAVDAARTLETIGRENRIGDAPEAFVWLEREVAALLQVMRRFQ